MALLTDYGRQISGHSSTGKVVRKPVLVYGSVFLMVEKDPFGVCNDCYTSVVFGLAESTVLFLSEDKHVSIPVAIANGYSSVH